jgi:hypothetical protein
MRKKISQRDALMYRKRVEELESILERQKSRYSSEWSPGFVNIESLTLSDLSYAKIATARILNHAVVAVCDVGNRVRFYADKL